MNRPAFIQQGCIEFIYKKYIGLAYIYIRYIVFFNMYLKYCFYLKSWKNTYGWHKILLNVDNNKKSAC